MPCLTLPTHLAERVGQPERNQQADEDLEGVREPVGILERMRGVGVEESSAVGAEILDGLHRGDRTLRDRLEAVGERVHDRVPAEVLDCPVGDEHQRDHRADR